MSTREELCTTFPRSCPPRLQATDFNTLPFRPVVLVVLLLATCAPRVWAACHWDVLWGDTLHYVYASDAMRRGDTHEALAEFGLNVYPVILCGLRQLSPDWETTGKWWSVLMATLTVLPLWSWLRRMFSDRVAAASCICYAFHGKLIAISPLMIRDATFIFFATVTLYLVWRAANEARFLLFLPAGIMLALAIHTRTEGWVLCVPVVGWSVVRAWNTPIRRWHVALGALLCLGCVPGLIALVNLVWLRDDPHWELLRPGHTQILEQFISQWRRSNIDTVPDSTKQSTQSPNAAKATTDDRSHQTLAAPSFGTISNTKQSSARTLNFKLLQLFAKSLTWIGGSLLLLGLIAAWRVFLRPEHLVIAAMNLLLLALIRIRFAQGLEIRYFMLFVLAALPWMGLGCLQLTAWSCFLAEKGLATRPIRKLLIIAVIGAVAASLSMFDGPLGAEGLMRQHAAVGRWILNTYGRDAAVAGACDGRSLDVYYSQCHVVQFFSWSDCQQDQLPWAVKEHLATVIVLWRNESSIEKLPDIVAKHIVADRTYRYIDPHEISPDLKEAMVFVRDRL